MTPNIVHLHPNAAFNISDYMNRLKCTNSVDSQVGLLLGRKVNSTISVFQCMEISPKDYASTERLQQHFDLISEIYGTGYLELVGFYGIGNVEESIFLTLASNATPRTAKSSSILKHTLDDFILMNVNKNCNQINRLSQLFKFTQLRQNTELNFDIKHTLSERISMSTYSNSPKHINEISNILSSTIESSLGEISMKLQKALRFLKMVQSREIDIDNNKHAREALKALSKVAHKVLVLEELVKGRKSSIEDDRGELIAVTSAYSSLMRGNI